MNAKAIFLFSAVLFVALNFCSGATTENQGQYREKRQYGGYGGYGGQVANSQATAVNNGAGGVANAISGSTNNGGYGGFPYGK